MHKENDGNVLKFQFNFHNYRLSKVIFYGPNIAVILEASKSRQNKASIKIIARMIKMHNIWHNENVVRSKTFSVSWQRDWITL